ncbi:MAG: HAD family hydrolase [Rubrobacteraceae bacterium]
MTKVRYDTVFLDVDGTLLWVDLDLAGYVEDISRYSTNGPLTVEKAAEPVWRGVRDHISQNIHYPTREELDSFKRENQRRTARALNVEAPPDLLAEAVERRISFNPYPESERVLEELRSMGLGLYVVSNWDILLEDVLEDLGWTRYFDGIIVSAAIGIEKPDPGIFEEALRVSGERRGRVLHVGNDPAADVTGAVAGGIDVVLVDREGGTDAPEAVAVMPDLAGLPAWIGSPEDV